VAFEVVCDASKYQIRSKIGQKTKHRLKPIAVFAAKNMPAHYTVTEQELCYLAMKLTFIPQESDLLNVPS
jgi:hypothetical protein